MGAGPLILSWINEICSADTEKRALLVAMANDLAYVVQAIVSANILGQEAVRDDLVLTTSRRQISCGRQQNSRLRTKVTLGSPFFRVY